MCLSEADVFPLGKFYFTITICAILVNGNAANGWRKWKKLSRFRFVGHKKLKVASLSLDLILGNQSRPEPGDPNVASLSLGSVYEGHLQVINRWDFCSIFLNDPLAVL